MSAPPPPGSSASPVGAVPRPTRRNWAAAGRYGSFEEAAHGSLALFPSRSPAGVPVHALPALTLSRLLRVGKQAESFLVVSFFSSLCVWVPSPFDLKRVSLLNERGVFQVLLGWGGLTLYPFWSCSQAFECSSKNKQWSVNLPYTVVWQHSLWRRELRFQTGCHGLVGDGCTVLCICELCVLRAFCAISF